MPKLLKLTGISSYSGKATEINKQVRVMKKGDVGLFDDARAEYLLTLDRKVGDENTPLAFFTEVVDHPTTSTIDFTSAPVLHTPAEPEEDGEGSDVATETATVKKTTQRTTRKR